jgi:pyridoxal phosphate enzyme (YggS family)
MPPTIRENILRIQDRIAKAKQNSPHPTDVTLIAVSKTHPPESICEAYEAGLRHFGENRVQEWEGKRPQLEDLQATWHLIGHLQSNKSARAAKAFDSVDSVDDFALAQRLDHARTELSATEKLRVLIEVRVENEATKTGAEVHTVPQLLEKISQLKNLEVAGLMCIPPFSRSPSSPWACPTTSKSLSRKAPQKSASAPPSSALAQTRSSRSGPLTSEIKKTRRVSHPRFSRVGPAVPYFFA